MKNRKKFILALSSLGVMVVVAFVSVAVVLSAIFTTVSHKFTITYSAKAVNADVSVAYKAEVYDDAEANGTKYTEVKAGDKTTLSFRKTEQNDTGSFADVTNNNVSFNQFYVVRYTITNVNETGSSDFCISLNETQNLTKYGVCYFYTTDQNAGETIINGIKQDVNKANPAENDYLELTDLTSKGFKSSFEDAAGYNATNYAGQEGVVLNVGKTAYIYFAYVLENPDEDASIGGTVAWTLDARFSVNS